MVSHGSDNEGAFTTGPLVPLQPGDPEAEVKIKASKIGCSGSGVYAASFDWLRWVCRFGRLASFLFYFFEKLSRRNRAYMVSDGALHGFLDFLENFRSDEVEDGFRG